MVQFNTRANEILLKLVYYGPGLSGKTTNLQILHSMCSEGQRGEMFSVNTQEDRTLFFDLLPINLGYIYGNAIHLQVYTVPGQVQYDASRRVVLGGADGVVFVADSSESKMQDNVDSLSNLYHNLNANRLNIKQIPFVIQYNKRDLPDAMAVGVMNRRLNFRSVPYFEATAYKGMGVLDTFLAVTKETVAYTFKKYHLDKKIKDFDEMLGLIESNIRGSMRELPPAPPEPPQQMQANQDQTVLRHSNVSVNDLQPGHVADAQELLEDALKSNMETARLYSELKSTKESLERKNEEMAQLYQQLERVNQDNQKTRRYLEGLVQSMGEALVSFTPEGKILTWNAAAERIFGYPRPEIVGKPMGMLVPDSIAHEAEQQLQQVVRGQQLRDLESIRLRKGGIAFPAQISYAPVRGADERVLAVSALVRDLEEKKNLESQLAQSRQFESLGRLVPGLFHEVANRLTPVLLESRLLLESAMDPHQQEQATRLAKAAESLQSMLEPMLLVLDPPAPRRTAVNLNQLAQECLRQMEPQAQRQAASLETSLDPALPVAGLDAEMVAQALQGLVTQGLSAMAQSPTKRLRVATRRAGDSLQVLVQDSGTPLSPEELSALLKPTRATSAEHLAVPLAEAIARTHGGKLTLRSQMGLGNAYLMELPFSEAPAAPAPQAPATLSGLRALVVDDESFLLECLQEALQAWGVNVTTAGRGDAAVAKLQEMDFDFVLSDIRMPGLTGMDIYAWLQGHKPDLTRRILFTTGDAFDAETQAFLEKNSLPHLGKPFDLKKLKGAVAQLAASVTA
jgi:PAS domain S-box-containing protein